MNLTIDTFAWVEVFRGSPVGRRAQALMNAAEDCFTPSITLAEVASISLRSALPDALIEDELASIAGSSKIVRIDAGLAVAAARALKELREASRSKGLGPPGLADGLVLATARALGAKVLTGDPHFRSCAETVWLE